MQPMDECAEQNNVIERLDTILLFKVLAGVLLIILGVAFRPVMYLACVYSFVVVLFTKDEGNVIAMQFAWLSFSPIFKFSPNSTSVFTILELVFVAKLIMCNRRVEKKTFVLLLIYSIYVIAGASLAFSDLVKTILVPIILYLIIRSMDLAGSLVGLCRAWIPNLNSFITYKNANLAFIEGRGFDAVTRFSGLWGDPNYYSIHLLLVMSICIVFYVRKQLKPIPFMIIYGVSILFGAFTGSKSFFIMAALVTIFFVVTLIYNHQFSRMTIVLLALVVVLILMIQGKIDVFSTVFSRLINDTTGVSGTDITTGRLQLITYYLQLFANNPAKFVFGNGVGVGLSYRPPHNTLFDFLDILGLVGTTIMSLLLYHMYKNTPKEGQGSKFVLLIVPMFFVLSMFYSIDFCFELALVFCFLRQGQIKQEESL